MDVVEVSARTVDEAIEKALERIGLSRDQVTVTVLNQGKGGGLFGLGGEDALVRVERNQGVAPAPEPAPVPVTPPADIAARAVGILQDLLRLMDVEGEVVPVQNPVEAGQDETAIVFDIEGDDLGILIGRRGQTLAALQYMLRLIVGRQTGSWTPIVVDAESYKQRRIDALRSLALRIAEQVKARGAPFTLEPMPPYERRIVHLALADSAGVYTESIGEGEGRKVVIRPKQPSGGPPREARPMGQPRGGSTLGRGGYESNRDSGYSRRQPF